MGQGVGKLPQPKRLRGLWLRLLVLALIVLVPALSVGAAGAWLALTSYDRALQDRLQDTARALGLVVEREMEQHFASLAGLAASPALDGELEADLAPFYRHAKRAAEAVGTSVALIGPDLRIRLDTDRPFGAALPATQAVAATRRTLETGQPAVSDLLVSAVTGRPGIMVNSPVMREGHILAVVGTWVEPASLSSLLAAPDLTGNTFAALIDSRHVLVARSRAAERFSGTTIPAGLVRVMQGRSMGGGEGRALEGEEVLYAFRAIEGLPGWNIVVAAPLAASRAIWNRPLLALAGGGLAAMLLALAAARWLSRRVLAPIAALQRQAEAVAQGRDLLLLAPLAETAEIKEFAALQRALAAAAATLRRQMEAERHAVDALLASERRYRALAEAGAVALWQADAAGNILESRGWELLTGQAPEQLQGTGWAAAIHPEDAATTLAAWQAAFLERRPLNVQFRVRRHDGAWLWVRSRGVPVLSPDGRLVEWAGVVEDTDAQRRAAELQRLLAREVDHRAKNVLSIVQSVVRLTRTEEPGAFVAAVEARIAALARAHALLAQEGWAGADLRAIAEREFAPYATVRCHACSSIRLEGPPLPLAATAVQPLAMVLHELATNAAKYGALSRPDGTLTLRWALDRNADLLVLDWLETGGPPLQGAPARSGFGSRIIEATLRSQLRGQMERRWEGSGLACRITLPLARTALAEPAGESRPAFMVTA
ncbi:HWE histidine kinase domain-containing protein [Roseomonas sp. E05]|uniref:HWE histidine kinase domain-containing protein n=1 Tax=Roseomonas sp. E05 TaxID=3046310 RepID=UPI0024BA7C76|nr:HWE histidine kinase domain-containing protein [Roseomonas sp. E05]MDJ0389230.1 HWE histidine kinase domain-containing protein [Roseomonas sp. E05]